MRYVNGTRLDDRIVRTDWDAGFKEGRQYGRGKSGGQVCMLSSWYLIFDDALPQYSLALLTTITIAADLKALNLTIPCVLLL